MGEDGAGRRFDVGVERIAGGVHGHNGGEVLHLQMPHGLRDPELQEVDVFHPSDASRTESIPVSFPISSKSRAEARRRARQGLRQGLRQKVRRSLQRQSPSKSPSRSPSVSPSARFKPVGERESVCIPIRKPFGEQKSFCIPIQKSFGEQESSRSPSKSPSRSAFSVSICLPVRQPEGRKPLAFSFGECQPERIPSASPSLTSEAGAGSVTPYIGGGVGVTGAQAEPTRNTSWHRTRQG